MNMDFPPNISIEIACFIFLLVEFNFNSNLDLSDPEKKPAHQMSICCWNFNFIRFT